MEEQGPEDMLNMVDLKTKTLHNTDGSLDKIQEVFVGLQDSEYDELNNQQHYPVRDIPSLSKESKTQITKCANYSYLKTFKERTNLSSQEIVADHMKKFKLGFQMEQTKEKNVSVWIDTQAPLTKPLVVQRGHALFEDSKMLENVPLKETEYFLHKKADNKSTTTFYNAKAVQHLPNVQASQPRNVVRWKYTEISSEMLTALTSSPLQFPQDETEQPTLGKDSKNFVSKRLRLRVAPIPPDSSYHTAKCKCQHVFDFCKKKTLYKTKQLTLRDNIWLPLDELPWPRLDNIKLYYVDRFDPLNVIIRQIAEGKSPRPQVTMMYELLRLCTLRTYPKDNKPFMIRVAAAGFYYASDGDGVVCYCCGIRRYGWVEADDPIEVHKRINPRCRFIINNSEHNVPAIAYGPLRRNVANLDLIPDCDRVLSPVEDVNNSQRARLGVQMSIPKHAHMAIKTVREQSFDGNWPNTPKYSPAQLADGGFFFTGLGDCVRCFFCGIGLRHWDKDDDMWAEHARWSQNCTFLIQKKGQNFVDLIQLAVEHINDSDESSNYLYKNLVSESAQYVLNQSIYTTQQINDAIVAIVSTGGRTMVTVSALIEKVAQLTNQSATNVKHTEEPGNHAEPAVRNCVSDNEVTDNVLSNNPEDIKQENEQLKEQTLCKVCLDNIVSIVFLPCGHLVTCADCAHALRKCPICRADVKGTVRTRMS